MWRPLLDSQSLSPCPVDAVTARDAGFAAATQARTINNLTFSADGNHPEMAPSEQKDCKECI